MRPRFTVSNLLLLTVIVAIATLAHRNRVRDLERIRELESELTRMDAIREQAAYVVQAEAELRVANQELKPRLALAEQYRAVGAGDVLTNVGRRYGIELTGPDGYPRGKARFQTKPPYRFIPSAQQRTESDGLIRAQARVRNEEREVKRGLATLQRLVRELNEN